jgi:PAS domain S-box-containing protein
MERNGMEQSASELEKKQVAVPELSVFATLRVKLLILFLFLSLVPSLLIGILAYQEASSALHKRIKDEMGRIVQIQVTRIENMFLESLITMRAMADTDGVRSMEPQKVYSTILSFTKHWGGFERLAVYRADGRAVAESVRGLEETLKSQETCTEQGYFQRAIRGDEDVSDPIRSGTGEGFFIVTAVPIWNLKRDSIVGVATASLTTEEIARVLMESRIGETGDVYLINQDSYFITPSRFTEELRRAGLIKERSELELRVDSVGSRQALAGKTGLEMYKDYRGRQVIGAYAPIMRTGWGLLVEQEVAEAFAPLARLRNIALLIGIIFACFIGCIAFFVARGISNNIVSLSKVARELQVGNLSVRAGISSKDEVGQLAQSFNDMADRIANLIRELEQQVAVTKASNEELQRQIVERMRAEKSLSESEIRYRSLFDGVPVGLYRTSPEGQILDANPELVQILGYSSREDLLAMNTESTYVNREDRERWKVLMEQEGVVSYFEIQMRKPNGEIIWVSNTGRAVKDEKGGVFLYEGCMVDVTEQKRKSEELKRYREHLEELVEQRTRNLSLANEELESEILRRKQTEGQLRMAEKEAKDLSEFLKKMFGRYLSPEVMDSLLENPAALELGGAKRKVTIMITDLRGFTALAERFDPEQVVTLLNSYFETMLEVTHRYQGAVNEIIGDSILVIFGAPQEMPDRAQRAIACAIAMQNAMSEVNEKNRERGLPGLEMGIGLHDTEVIVGNIGSSKRVKYSVVGSGVNLTSRIESYTVGGQILISESVKNEAGGVLRIDGQREVLPKGAEFPIRLYEVGGISGSYNLVLEERDAALITLRQRIPLKCTLLQEKHIGGRGVEGFIVKLSRSAAEIALNRSLELFTDMKMNLKDVYEELTTKDFYGKVTAQTLKDENNYLIRFTSLPPEVTAYFQAHQKYAQMIDDK